tara:strand:+ start:4904 stop:5140 length:237 start_codon:yes stop_codon:yes gene_type:complete
MAALRTLSYLTRAAMLLACAWVFSVAAQDLEQSAAQEVETEEASESAQDAESEEESGARFIPTEEISQDFGVSFPVDI